LQKLKHDKYKEIQNIVQNIQSIKSDVITEDNTIDIIPNDTNVKFLNDMSFLNEEFNIKSSIISSIKNSTSKVKSCKESSDYERGSGLGFKNGGMIDSLAYNNDNIDKNDDNDNDDNDNLSCNTRVKNKINMFEDNEDGVDDEDNLKAYIVKEEKNDINDYKINEKITQKDIDDREDKDNNNQNTQSTQNTTSNTLTTENHIFNRNTTERYKIDLKYNHNNDDNDYYCDNLSADKLGSKSQNIAENEEKADDYDNLSNKKHLVNSDNKDNTESDLNNANNEVNLNECHEHDNLK